VVIRSLEPLKVAASHAGSEEVIDWTTKILAAEHERIANALEFLDSICRELEVAGCPTTVMKSLDHWPDIGNDLDLYTTATKDATRCVLEQKFGALALSRTWGDRLAEKCSYRIPGLRRSIGSDRRASHSSPAIHHSARSGTFGESHILGSSARRTGYCSYTSTDVPPSLCANL
jgi:hypothetical protein